MRFRYLWSVLSIMGLLLAAWAPVFAVDTIPAHEALTSPDGTAATAATAAAIAIVFIRETLLPIVSAIVMTLFTLLMNRLSQKWKIQSLADQNGYLFKLAGQGIALAEERAAKRADSINKLTGSQKLDIAVGHILSYFPKISHSEAQDIVHSVLAMTPGAGATGEAVTLLPGEGGYSIPVPSADEVQVIQGPAGPMGPAGLMGPAGPTAQGA